MKGLFQRLTKASGPMQAGKPEARLTLAAFGKHPGWDDHMPGIGLETDALVLAKQVFYVHGIGGQVDSGAWEKIEPSKRLDGYDHTFLWLLPGHAILGRLWSSTDGKGRSKYPMVVCLDAEGFRPARIIETLRPELEQLRVFCQSTNDSNRVVAQCHSLQDRLRSYLLTPLPSASGLEPPLEVRRRFLEQPELGPDRVGLLRVLHELEKAVQVFSRAPDTRLGMVADLYHVRLPQASSSAEEGLLLWAAFLRCIFNQSVPLLLLVREKHTWIDVIIGEPKSDDFFCLQASAQAAPLATEIPYELAPELRLRLQELEAKFLGLESKPTPITPLTGGQGTAPSVSAKPSEPPGRSKVWMALVPLLLLLVAGVLLFPKSGSPTGATGPSPTSSRPSPPAPVSATPLTVVAQPQDQTLLEGGDVLLASQIVGPASIRYQWVHEGTNLPGQTNVTLRLGGVRTNDAGRYWLMIASEDGSTNTRAAHVNITEILSPPTIVAHPTNQTVMEGAEALFTVSAHGRAPLWFQWVHDGTNLPGQTNLSLRLTAVSPYHSGRYWMVVSNAAGSTNSQPATLAIQPAVRPVSLVSQPQSQTVTEGADVLLSIQAGGTGPLHFQWLHEGTNLPGQTGATLQLPAVAMIQAGRYHAIVSNSAGSTSSLVALLTTQPLFLPPIIQIQPVSQTATEGESVQFRVDARGNGPLKYQWLHEGANLPQATNATLRLAKLNAGQSGRYLVVVSNGGKSTNSETAILTVKRRAIAPTLTGQPQSQSVAEGTNVLFAAEAQGSTPLFYQWSHNGRSLPGQTNAQLQLLAVTTNDAGIYAIEVRNEAGAARSAEAALTLVAPAGAAGADSKSLDAVLENYEVLLRITKPPKGSSDSALPRGRIPLDRFNDYLARFDDLQRRYDQGGWLDANRRARLQNLREKLKEWR